MPDNRNQRQSNASAKHALERLPAPSDLPATL
jgi:hypothetical protein